MELSKDNERRGKVLNADSNGNLIDCRTVLPSLLSDMKAGERKWFVTAVFAMPASVENWKDSWRTGWSQLPEIPNWLGQKMA